MNSHVFLPHSAGGKDAGVGISMITMYIYIYDR